MSMDWRYNTIWFDQIEKEKFSQIDCNEKSISSLNLDVIEYCIIWHFKNKKRNFENLPDSESLQYLELNWANPINFQGLEKYTNLKRLELHYCTKLETDIGLSRLKDSLEHLHINQSKKFNISTELEELKNLRVLALNNCAPIDNLNFLSKLPNLIDFRFAYTNIINGDLSPILKHPNLKTVAFDDKRHYNFKAENLRNALNLKSTEEFREYVYKGEFRTFRYKVTAANSSL